MLKQETVNIEHIKTSGNNLFPVFLKLESLRLLIVGGGNVAFEKLTTVIQNSPATQIKLIGTEILDKIKELSTRNDFQYEERAFVEEDLDDIDVVILAVNDKETSKAIRRSCKEKGKLVNVADQPELCDFYLGSIITKGSLKIAISTNGKSPTIAKRLKEVIGNLIPDEMENVLQNMSTIRNGMNGDFNEKVRQLNDLTKVLVAKKLTLEDNNKPEQKRWSQIVTWCLLIFVCMIIGHGLFSLVSFQPIVDEIIQLPQKLDKTFYLMLITGFAAQMVDGSLGMGYGTISTTFLLAIGVNPAIVSSRVHSARVFSSGISGYTHHRFKNINKKLFRTLVVPGVIGALIGATLAFLGQNYINYVRIPLSIYTLYLGYFIVKKAFASKKRQDKVKRAGWLATTGGFLDAFAGGGWGTLVTSTLIAKRRTPRYVIGSVCLAEFFVVLASSITFFILLKNIPLLDIAGLIIGGLIAAPIAARLVGKLPLKKTYVAVGIMVILTSISTLYKALQFLF